MRAGAIIRLIGAVVAYALGLCCTCAAQGAHLRATFEDGSTGGWTPSRAFLEGKHVGALPEVKLAAAPQQPTYGGSKFALLLEDLVGDSPEANADVHFPPITITEHTMVSLAFCWDSESGNGYVNMRLPTAGSLKYHELGRTEAGKWHTITARVVDFVRGDVHARVGEAFDGFCVRITSTGWGWRRLWVDNLVIYEGPDTPPPAAIAALKAVQRGPRIELTWEEPADDTAVVSYGVHRDRERGFAPTDETLIARTRERTFSDVPGAQGPWFYRVRASDYGGNVSEPSRAASVTVAVSPLRAPRLTEPDEGDWKLSGERMGLRWEAVPEARGYLVQYARDPRFANAIVREAAQPELELGALPPGIWHWRALALDAKGLGSEFSPARGFAIRRYYDTVPVSGHPRLYFEAKDLPRLRAAMEAEPMRAIWESIKRRGDGLLEKPCVEYEPGERWGTFLIATRRANSVLETLSLCYALTGDERYAEKAREQADVVLSWDCWVDPVHGGAAARADLATGEICLGLGLFYDWCFDALTEQERAEIRETLVNRGIVPVYERSVEGAHWSRTHTNWCAVVHGGAGVAALALLGEEPAAPQWLEQFETKLRCYLDAFDSQGGWVEGPGYWGYGMSYALWFIDALRRVTHGERDLYRHERLTKTLNFVLHCTMPDGRGTVNFADSWYGPFSSFLVGRLAAEYQNPFAAKLVEERPGSGVRDFLWHDGIPAGRRPTPEELPPAMLFPDIHWAVLRQGWVNPQDCLFAIKGGSNNDWHGHRDMGHFILNAFGKRLIIDQGGGLYRKEYWQGQDYEVQSEGHNTLLLDGKGQQRNRAHDARITRFFHSPGCDYVLCDASRAYGERLTRFHRHVVYLRPDTFVLFDDIAAAQPTRIEALLHTFGSTSREGNVLRFEDEPAALLTRVVLPADFVYRIEKGANTREEWRDNYVGFGPEGKVRKARFLLAMRPALTSEPAPGVLLWEDFERGSVTAWKPSRAYIEGKPVGTLPSIKLAVAPDEPTHGESKFALLLDDPVGDSPEACADLRFPAITVTPHTRISFACRWESESGEGRVDARINAGGPLKYYSPAKVGPGQWAQFSARALDFRRGEIPTREGEQFSGLTIRLVGTDKGWRRLWIDDVAIHECPREAAGPPRAIPLDPDSFLAAETVGDADCTGLRLRRSGMPGEDLVLFRTDSDINTRGIATDAEVCVISITPGGNPLGFFVHQARRLSHKGAPLLACSEPASVWFEFGAEEARGVVEATAPLEIRVGTPGKPTQVLVNGKAAGFEFDGESRMWRVSFEEGRSRVLVTW